MDAQNQQVEEFIKALNDPWEPWLVKVLTRILGAHFPRVNPENALTWIQSFLRDDEKGMSQFDPKDLLALGAHIAAKLDYFGTFIQKLPPEISGRLDPKFRKAIESGICGDVVLEFFARNILREGAAELKAEFWDIYRATPLKRNSQQDLPTTEIYTKLLIYATTWKQVGRPKSVSQLSRLFLDGPEPRTTLEKLQLEDERVELTTRLQQIFRRIGLKFAKRPAKRLRLKG